MNVIDLDDDSHRQELSPAPPGPSSFWLAPDGPSVAAFMKRGGRPVYRTSTEEVPEDVELRSELGDELARRLDKIDSKLDLLVARAAPAGLADARPHRSAEGSGAAAAAGQGPQEAAALADVGPPRGAAVRPGAPVGKWRSDTVATMDSSSMPVGTLSRVSTLGSDGGRVPNLSRRRGGRSMAWAGSVRQSRFTQVPAMFKSQFLARRMYEKSASKNIDNLQERMRALPKAMRSERNKTVDYIFTVLDDPSSSKVAWWVAIGLQAIVLLSVLGTFLQTVEDPPLYGQSAAIVETVFDVVFAGEVCIRWGCAPNWVTFVFITQSWIDIAAASAIAVRAGAGFVLPDSHDDSASIFLLLFVPIIRLLKIVRHFETFNVLIKAVKITMEALPMLMYAVALVTMTFATLIYLVEPELFESPFRAVWFCLVTVTTVGYGDYSPVTTAGITIAMVLIVLGVILMAVPVGIIGMTFHEEWNARDYSLLLRKTRMKLHQWGYTAHDIPNLFKIVDSDENGVLELDEFCELVKEMKIGLSEDRIIALFEHMDKDGSGALDAAEFALEVFPETFIEAFGHAGQTNPSRDSTHWMSSLAAAINGGKSFQRDMPGVTVINED